MEDSKRILISGPALPLRGNDIDTDRIIPARYLRTVTFEGLGEHAFEDDRVAVKNQGKLHPFDDPRYTNAAVLIVNQNFGCGSSREHAPQSLLRWGIRAIIGESFAEIFYGNCIALGIPCPTLGQDQVNQLMRAVEADPGLQVRVDVETQRVTAGALSYPCDMPAGPRQQFLEGRWDSTTELLESLDQVRAQAQTLPYFDGYTR